MQYYIKRCGRQELGSVDADGHPHRGRYLLTSKNKDVLGFFPILSEQQLNDFAPVGIIPLYEPDRTVYCNFVYHNDKYHNSTAVHPRDEYRLYLNLELEGGQYRFKEGDYLIFRRVTEEDGKLYLYHVTSDQSNLVDFCDRQIKHSSIRGGYALCNDPISAVEDSISTAIDTSQTILVDEVLQKRLQQTLTTEHTLFTEQMSSLFKSQSMFRDFVAVGYEGKCAITRKVIRYHDLMNIEAAHIRPRAHNGNSLPSNGMMLSRDFHWAFDKGFFTLTDDFRIRVHSDVDSDFLSPYDGQKIFLPSNTFFQPSLENIRWHREHVYGLFRDQGSIREMN